jgi:hypothetical protein
MQATVAFQVVNQDWLRSHVTRAGSTVQVNLSYDGWNLSAVLFPCLMQPGAMSLGCAVRSIFWPPDGRRWGARIASCDAKLFLASRLVVHETLFCT